MAEKLLLSGYYGTHLPALMRCMERTTGPVLELGMGIYSTPFLHYACQNAGRHLTSYETDAKWAGFFTRYGYESDLHSIRIVADWDAAEIERPWDVALVDHDPSGRRIVDIKRLAPHARYIVAHDADAKFDMVYHYSRIYPLFQHRTLWDREWRHAVVLSNFNELKGFWD